MALSASPRQMIIAYFDASKGVTGPMILEALSHFVPNKNSSPKRHPAVEQSFQKMKKLFESVRKIKPNEIEELSQAALLLQPSRWEQIVASPIPFHPHLSGDLLTALKNLPLEKSKSIPSINLTGIILLKTMATHFGECPLHKIENIGSAASGPFRILIGQGFKTVQIEANIDDMNPQWFDYVMEKLFAIGVVDVSLQPVQMKKNRPAILLRAISPWDLKEKAMEIILKETTTLGVRYFPLERKLLTRTLQTVRTAFGNLPVKIARDETLQVKKFIPEYEALKKVAREQNIPIRKVYDEVLRACQNHH